MLELFSPAKINLFLRVVSKRPDGYHHLSSVFQAISLGDTLHMTLHHKDVFTCTDPSLPTDRSNLVVKAVELFRQKTGLQHYYKIHLIKRIPAQAGLGGGSSNAATALWGCNLLTKTHVESETLMQWGGELGSDVPFFFSQGTAFCTGRGESVRSLPPLASRPVWILKPSYGLSTPEVYRRLNFSAVVPESVVQQDLDHFMAGTLPLFNDLESPAFEIEPSLRALKDELLQRGFETVLMSGSGSSFFCMGEGKLPADPHRTVFPVQFVQRSKDQWYTNNSPC